MRFFALLALLSVAIGFPLASNADLRNDLDRAKQGAEKVWACQEAVKKEALGGSSKFGHYIKIVGNHLYGIRSEGLDCNSKWEKMFTIGIQDVICENKLVPETCRIVVSHIEGDRFCIYHKEVKKYGSGILSDCYDIKSRRYLGYDALRH